MHRLPLPQNEGRTVLGEWKVPGWLDGFTLRLDVEGAPGTYRVDARDATADPILLCDPCKKGRTVRIEARTTGAWEAFPAARIVGVEHPAAGDAAAWLRLLDEDGSREYRKRAAAAAGS